MLDHIPDREQVDLLSGAGHSRDKWDHELKRQLMGTRAEASYRIMWWMVGLSIEQAGDPNERVSKLGLHSIKRGTHRFAGVWAKAYRWSMRA